MSARQRARQRWQRVRVLKDVFVLCRRWHSDVDRCYKVTWLQCKGSHTLLAGVCFRGALGFTRAQSVQVLFNSLALELVLLCLEFSAETPGEISEIELFGLLVSGVVAAAITIPSMLVFALAFTPQVAINLAADLARTSRQCWRDRRQIAYAVLCAPCGAQRAAEKQMATSHELAMAHARRRNAQLRKGPDGKISVATTAAIAGASPTAPGAPPLAHSAPGPMRRGRTRGARTSIVDAFRSQRQLSLHRQRPRRAQGAPRQFSYASLNEYVLTFSLTRAIRRREPRTALRIALGWALNLCAFAVMVCSFVVYCCIFQERGSSDAVSSLFESWGLSLVQRFLLAEPLIILVAVGLPLIFASDFCSNLFSESCNHALGVGLATLVSVFKRLKRVG